MAGWSGDQITVGVRFTTPIQKGNGAHPALYNGYQVFYPEVERLAHALTTHIRLTLQIKKNWNYTSICHLSHHGLL
jgi:hypothetical protein